MSGSTFKAGELVQVRSRQEILATLDSHGCLNGMPFMPEMLQFCGRTLRIAARAHKTCDTVNNTGGVWAGDAVHLDEARCDGSAHGGCQAACLLFWKGAWVERVSAAGSQGDAKGGAESAAQELPRGWSFKSPPGTVGDEVVYRCQATELPGFTSPMRWWDTRQYIEDLTSRNIGLRTLFRGMRLSLFRAIITLGIGYRFWVAFYNKYQAMRGGNPFPWVTGKLNQTPTERLNLQPGEWVRVKPFEQIMGTLDINNKNRGLGFDTGEMGMHCRKSFQVERHVDRIINERTGKMLHFKEPSVVLRGMFCTGETTNVRMFCPRAIPPYWREIWLERIDPEPGRRA